MEKKIIFLPMEELPRFDYCIYAKTSYGYIKIWLN